MQPLVPLAFHNLPSLYPPSFSCYTAFWLCQCTIYNIGAKKRFALYMQLSFPSSLLFAITVDTSLCSIELGPHRYDATLLTSTLCYTRWSHSAHYYHNTCARGRRRRGTLSKMASFIVDSCRDLRFSLEMWDWRRTIAWGRCTPLTIVDQFGIKISGFTPSYEALGRLEYDDENSDFAYERFLVWRDEGS